MQQVPAQPIAALSVAGIYADPVGYVLLQPHPDGGQTGRVAAWAGASLHPDIRLGALACRVHLHRPDQMGQGHPQAREEGSYRPSEHLRRRVRGRDAKPRRPPPSLHDQVDSERAETRHGKNPEQIRIPLERTPVGPREFFFLQKSSDVAQGIKRIIRQKRHVVPGMDSVVLVDLSERVLPAQIPPPRTSGTTDRATAGPTTWGRGLLPSCGDRCRFARHPARSARVGGTAGVPKGPRAAS